MTRVVRAAVSPVLGHTPTPFKASTTVWISGCCTCSGCAMAMLRLPSGPRSSIGSFAKLEKRIRPRVPAISTRSGSSKLVKLQIPTPWTPEAKTKLAPTVSSAG